MPKPVSRPVHFDIPILIQEKEILVVQARGEVFFHVCAMLEPRFVDAVGEPLALQGGA